VTCVLAKTTKVKNNFSNGKKTLERILGCVFGGRPSYKFAFGNFMFVVGSVANVVGVMLEFAAFCSAFCFFCPQPWFLWWFDHIFPGKTSAVSCR